EIAQRSVEHADRIGELLVLVRSPADLPRRPFRITSGRKVLVQLAECLIGLCVVVLNNVTSGEIVQRLLGPTLRRKVGHNTADGSQVLVVLAELADRDRIEEQRFPLTRGVLDVLAN